MKKEINPAITIALIVVVALIAGYFLLIRSDTGSVNGGVAHSKSAKQESTDTPPANNTPSPKDNSDK